MAVEMEHVFIDIQLNGAL